jgi:outer membrane murein-binding lipoprotein Lpp
MKNIFIGILVITTLAMGGLWLDQVHKASLARATVDSLEQNVTDLQSKLAEQEQHAARANEKLEAARAEAAAKSEELTQLRARPAEDASNPAAGAKAKGGQTNSMASAFAGMFKDPAMRDMIKKQQKSMFGPMIDKNYGKLMTDLQLSAEQAASFKDLLLNKQLAAADIGMSMFSDDGDGTNRAAMAQQVKAASDAADAQIKDLLGDDNYAQFQAYEKTMSERMVVNGLKDQLGTGADALTDEQEQQLITEMTQTKDNFKFTTDLSDKSKMTGDFASFFTEDKMNTYFSELDQLNQQYQTGAQGILSADQLSALGKYLNGQETMQKAGMQMAVKMFSAGKSGGN